MKLGKGDRKCMIVIAQHRDEGVARVQLQQMTGYTRRTRDSYILNLRNAGFVVENASGRIEATNEGVEWLGDDYEELPTGDALYRYWLTKLPQGEKRVLEFLHDEHPDDVERTAIDEALKYTRRTRDSYLLALKNRRLIEEPSRGTVVASDVLFD